MGDLAARSLTSSSWRSACVAGDERAARAGCRRGPGGAGRPARGSPRPRSGRLRSAWPRPGWWCSERPAPGVVVPAGGATVAGGDHDVELSRSFRRELGAPGERDERDGEHAERERDDDGDRDDRRLPVRRRRQARARGGAAAQAPLLLGVKRSAAQRARSHRPRGAWVTAARDSRRRRRGGAALTRPPRVDAGSSWAASSADDPWAGDGWVARHRRRARRWRRGRGCGRGRSTAAGRCPPAAAPVGAAGAPGAERPGTGAGVPALPGVAGGAAEAGGGWGVGATVGAAGAATGGAPAAGAAGPGAPAIGRST